MWFTDQDKKEDVSRIPETLLVPFQLYALSPPEVNKQPSILEWSLPCFLIDFSPNFIF